MNKEYILLLKAVEEALGRSIVSTTDFKYLSQKIFENTHELLSASTLMRLWGRRSQVNPRKSTLDILARFIGYKDYADFFSSVKDEDKNAKKPDETATFAQKKHSAALWFAGIFAVLLIAAGIAYLIIDKEHTPRRILQLDELKSNKQYIITSRHAARGKLGVFENVLATTYELAKDRRCLEQSTFAFIQYEGDYYLYSVEDKQFLNVWAHEVEAPIAANGVKLSLTPKDSCFVFSFVALGHTYTLNVNANNGIIITEYGIETGDYDDGNMLEIYEAGDFDPTEPLQRISQFKAEAERARNTLTAEKEYCVYTLADADGKEGKTRRYLTAGGRLTDTLTDSCRFTLHAITGDTLYTSPSFRLCLHEAGQSVPQGCKTGFHIPKNGSEKKLLPTSHLEVAKYYSDPFNGQVFFYGNNGRYAIRSTCAPTSGFFSFAYWDIAQGNKDTEMVVGYSAERRYIWHIDPL